MPHTPTPTQARKNALMSDDAEVQSIEAARLQAIEFLGFMAPRRVRVGDEVFEIPNPSLLSKAQRRAYDELQLSLEGLDRWPDVKNEDGEVIRLGEPKVPHRQKGKLVDDYDTRLTVALFGAEAAERYFAKGGQPGDVALFWTEMNQRVNDRRAKDSKSDGGSGAVASAAVPDRL
jgi:hypothetical protein